VFENWSTFGEVMIKSLSYSFLLTHSVQCTWALVTDTATSHPQQCDKSN